MSESALLEPNSLSERIRNAGALRHFSQAPLVDESRDFRSGSFSERDPHMPPVSFVTIFCGYGNQPSETSISFSESFKEIILNQAKEISTAFRNRVEELWGLESNWDGERAAPIRPDILAKAVHLVRRIKAAAGAFHEPFLAPIFNGFVQLEWHTKERYLEVEYTERGLSIVGSQLLSDEARDYFCTESPAEDFGFLLNCYNWYAGNELLWPGASA